MRPPKHNTTQHNQAALLNTARIQPGSQLHQCVGGHTVHPSTWLACTVPGLPQESLVRDETRISLPAKPSLTRTTLGQLCVAPWTSRLRQSLGANLESLVALRCSALEARSYLSKTNSFWTEMYTEGIIQYFALSVCPLATTLLHHTIQVYMCVYTCVCNSSQSLLFHMVYFYLLFKSDFTACVSYLMWNNFPCSHGSI